MLQTPDKQTNRILKLADFVEKSTDFNMSHWTTCLCGHIHRHIGSRNHDDWMEAAAFLGLPPTDKISQELFQPNGADCHQAAKMLRHFAVTGEINWFPGPKPLRERIAKLNERILELV